MATVQLFSPFPCKTRVSSSASSKSLSRPPILVPISSISRRPVISAGGISVSRADFRVRATDAEDEWGPDKGEKGSALLVAEEAIEAVEETEQLKRTLVDSLYGTDRGLNASSESDGEIGELITQLESKNPTPAPTEALFLLNGKLILASSQMSTPLSSSFSSRYASVTVNEFYQSNLNALQSGCCKPSNECNFTYVSATNWTKTAGPYKNEDCNVWGNKPGTLCYDCQACKAGLLDNLRNSWKKVAQVNIVFLVFLIIVYSIGCCAFRNNRKRSFY